MRIARPLVRWHGGKWKLAPWILSQIPAHRVYTEVFGGGASVLLKKPRSAAEVYNDLDCEIVNLMTITRDRPVELAEAVRRTPFTRAEFDLAFEASPDVLERARRLLVRSVMGRDSASASGTRRSTFRLYLGSATRAPTTQDWANLPSAIPAIAARLQGVQIENRDALDVLREHDAEDAVHYIDPPYLPTTRDETRGDYRHELDEADHIRLLETIKALRGRVLLSGYDNPLYRDLLANWPRVERRTHADGARERTEVLWLSPTAADAALRKAA